ncbi:MAG: ABC-F family ATP-binding cassette domain-containing protein [Myxococcales bacterium]|nr:ABC-F family ATP-binding cassette domain-containing protein [Myxococcales bacterium]USN51839.1 MAG: ABC-F family ATP-binding cassette domain-containing protein [Myxococcales bacterium]
MSQFIRLDGLSFSYPRSTSSVLKEISLSIDTGWTAVCGINGSGKSTLLNLLSKKLVPDSGYVEVNGCIEYLKQHHMLSEVEIDELYQDYSKKSLQLKASLELNELLARPFLELSFGEQKRMCLAFLLRKHPDILIVDEPTNHADAFTKNLIFNELKNFSGVGIVVSHDRSLLNMLAQKTIFIEEQRALFFDAPYSVALEEKKSMENYQQQSRQNKLSIIKKQKHSLQQKCELINKKSRCLSKKGIAKKDHDQKEKINRAKLFAADKSDSKAQRKFRQRLDNSIAELSSLKVKKEYELGAFFEDCPVSKAIHFSRQTITKNNMSIKIPDIVLEARSPVAIVGNNGCGKTTLLSYLATICPLKNFSFIPQELSQVAKKNLWMSIDNLCREKKSHLLSLVRRLGSDPSSIADGCELSPGLWQKLSLAFAVLESHPLIMMDEPTNHMDLKAIELLEQALMSYQGALLIVSHDQELIKNIGAQKLEISRQGSISLAQFVS